MKTCKLCKKPLSPRQKYFCSKLCLNTSNGYKKGLTGTRLNFHCKICFQRYVRKPSASKNTKYCSRVCQIKAYSEINKNREYRRK